MDIKLGLGRIPGVQYIFVGGSDSGNDTPYLWYSLLSKGAAAPEVIPIHEQCLTGYIVDLKMVNKPYKGKDAIKIDITVDADHRYVIRTGVVTVFARGLILALHSLSPELFLTPLSICVTPGDEAKVVYGSVYNPRTSQPVRFDWDKDIKLAPLIQDIQARLGLERQDINQMIADGRK